MDMFSSRLTFLDTLAPYIKNMQESECIYIKKKGNQLMSETRTRLPVCLPESVGASADTLITPYVRAPR